MKTPAFLFALLCCVFLKSDSRALGSERTRHYTYGPYNVTSFLILPYNDANRQKPSRIMIEDHKPFDLQNCDSREPSTMAEMKFSLMCLEAEFKLAVAKRNKRLQERQVAFSASLGDTSAVISGPEEDVKTLSFARVETNVGHAFNPSTGVFTAKVKGLYHFELNVYGPGNGGSGAWIMKNGRNMYIAFAYLNADHRQAASNSISLVLEAGDEVYVNQQSRTVLADNHNHLTTFNGYLMFQI